MSLTSTKDEIKKLIETIINQNDNEENLVKILSKLIEGVDDDKLSKNDLLKFGTEPPGTDNPILGQIYIDTAHYAIYIAFGTTCRDWRKFTLDSSYSGNNEIIVDDEQ